MSLEPLELRVYLEKGVDPKKFTSSIGAKEFDTAEDGAVVLPMTYLPQVIDRKFGSTEVTSYYKL